MSDKPQPLAFQPSGPNYAPVPMLPLDGMILEFLAGSTLLDGTATNALAVPAGAGSVFIESVGTDAVPAKEVRFRGKKVTPADATNPTSGAPTADVTNGSAGGWLPAGSAQTYSLLDSQGLPLYTHLSLKSAGGLRVTFYGSTK